MSRNSNSNLQGVVVCHLSKGHKSPRKAEEPRYYPELNISLVLGPDDASYYQALIGVMRWMIDIGHIDINIELSLLSSHSAISRQGHLVAVLHIVCYLKLSHNSRLAFVQSYPDIDHSTFWGCVSQIFMRVQ